MIIKISQDHISYASWCDSFDTDNPKANPITAALLDAGYSFIDFEIYLNLLPPRHDWKIIVDGTAYEMTYDCRDYCDRWRIERSRKHTKPADLILDANKMIADIRLFKYQYNPKQCPRLAQIDYNLWLVNGKVRFGELTEAERSQHNFMIFLGKRTENGCLVYRIGEDMSIEELTPDRSLEVCNHSPTGFEWGYGGSGPHQLALAILIEETTEQIALRLYHQFVWSVVCNLDHEEWAITEKELNEWIAKNY